MESVTMLKMFALFFFSSTVGWSRTSTRLCGAAKGDPDAVAPIHSQTLPHTALRVLKPRHVGRRCGCPAELGGRELEGMSNSSQQRDLDLGASPEKMMQG